MISTLLAKLKRQDRISAGIILIAFVCRVALLSIKPPHFDEGINGWFTDQLIARGFYPYDPTNYHGPLHFYILLIFKILFGRNVFALRIPTVIFGVASVYLVQRLAPFITKRVAYLASFFLAISPGLIFYSRYSIHETELLFFSILFLLGIFNWMAHKNQDALWQISLSIAGMAVTKETFIGHVAVGVIAFYCLKIYQKYFPAPDAPKRNANKFNSDQLMQPLGISVLFLFLFYTGFFQNLSGFVDFFRAFGAWFATGTKGAGHDKPFTYWISLMARYEWLSLFGFVGLLRLTMKSPYYVRYTGVYGLGVLLAYSIIKYKTPWCVIQILWPFLIVAAYVFFIIYDKYKKVSVGLVVLLCAASVGKAVELNFFKYTDDKEPYVYVQTFNDLWFIHNKLAQLVEKYPEKRSTPILVSLNSNWPLPWLWAEFPKVSWGGDAISSGGQFGLILIDQKNHDAFEANMKKKYYKFDFRLRSAQEPSVAYFDIDLFKEFFSDDFPVAVPRPRGPVDPGTGLRAEFYGNADWVGPKVFEEKYEMPALHLEDSNRPLGAPFGIIFRGEIKMDSPGSYYFEMSSDDGSELAIDGKVIISNLGPHALSSSSGGSEFKSGWHVFQLRYNDYGGGMRLELKWKMPGMAEFSTISPEYFRIPKVNK